MTVEVWYPLGVAGAGASFAAGGLAALRSRFPIGPVTAAAAGALAAILVVDLVPDVSADARTAGVPSVLLVAVALATFVWLWVVAGRSAHICGAAPSRLLPPAFLIHGFLEGIAGGTVLGWHASVGSALLLALVLHKTAEGADLGLALRGVDASHQAADPPSRRAWLLAAAGAPLLGCAAAVVLPARDQIGVVVMAAVCAVLAAACTRLLRRALGSSSALLVGTAATLGAAGMWAITAVG